MKCETAHPVSEEHWTALVLRCCRIVSLSWKIRDTINSSNCILCEPSKSLWWWYINTFIEFFDIHRLVFLFKTTFRRLDSLSICPEIGTSSIDWAQRVRYYLWTDRIQSPKQCVLNKKTGWWIMSKNSEIVIVWEVCFHFTGFSDYATLAYPTSKNYETVNVKAEANMAGSSLSVYKELVEARNTPSIMYGTSEFAVISNDTVFAFTRYVPCNRSHTQSLIKNMRLCEVCCFQAIEGTFQIW
jgi:hypothetical protein